MSHVVWSARALSHLGHMDGENSSQNSYAVLYSFSLTLHDKEVKAQRGESLGWGHTAAEAV